MGLIALTLVLGVAGSLLASELYAWSPRLVRWLVARAVARLPDAERDRYREEWSAHVEDVVVETAVPTGRATGFSVR